MDHHKYDNIHQQHLLVLDGDIFGCQDPNFVFLQSNASPHTTRNTIARLENLDFQEALWLGYSPDMNIVEVVIGRTTDRLGNKPYLTVA